MNTIGNNILAELHSIHHALKTVFTNTFKSNAIKEIIVLTDCQTAIKMTNNTLAFNTNTNQSNWFITSEIIKVPKFLRSVGIKAKRDWTPGHANDKLSNLADSLAKTLAHFSTLSVSTDCNHKTLRLDTTPVNFNNTTQFPPRNSKENCRKNLIKTNKTVNA